MKNFTVHEWNNTLAQFDFKTLEPVNNTELNNLALELSLTLQEALDIIAPKKFFTIRPNYVQGLSDKAKNLMKERDLTRSQLRKPTFTYAERKSLTKKYRKLRNRANEQIKIDKKATNGVNKF